MSDRIAVMSQGDVLQVGEPEEIYERPNCRFVADFIGETNFLQGSVIEAGAAASGEVVAVRLENGVTLRAAAAEPVAAGAAVSVAVRPEKLHLQSNGGAQTAAENRFTGAVASVVYIGTDTHYDVDLGVGQHVRVRRQNSAAGSPQHAQEGERVTVTFAPDAARVLAK